LLIFDLNYIYMHWNKMRGSDNQYSKVEK